jgi:hypothetical protein
MLLVVRGGSTPAIAPTTQLAVRATLDQPVVQFGDPLTARVILTLDRSVVRPQSLQVNIDLAPLTPLSAPVRTQTESGRLETITIAQRVDCLSDQCLAPTLRLPRVRVSAGALAATASWPRLHIRSRITAKDLARANPRFAADVTPPPLRYRVAPATAAAWLEAIAGLAAAGAVALLLLEARRRRRARVVQADELARALRLVRESEQRPVPDRRRALALLARVRPSPEVSDLAWSAPPPEPEALDELVSRFEGEESA